MDPTPNEPLGATDFDWDAIEPGQREDIKQAAVELAVKGFEKLAQWVYQPPAEDLDGLFCRMVIFCWIFVPSLRSYTMTDMAGRVGKKKQSLHRWTEEFKQSFPEVAKHLQHLKTT